MPSSKDSPPDFQGPPDQAAGRESPTAAEAPRRATHLLSPTELDTQGPIRRALVESHPERIGAYRVLKVLGKGGMGIVYLAEQEQPVRRHVALKLIQPAMDSRELLARFEAERQALAMLDHPNVAQIFEAGVSEGGWPYFAMEYVDGHPLLQYCERRGLGTRARLELFIPVCEALHHAHRRGILHRDVKPSNILVGEVDGRPLPKLIDFGLAKATDLKLTDRTLSTRLGQVLGTPAYMSPEQIAPKDGDALSPKTDVYALGVSLYQLLTGMLPFDVESLAARGYGELQRVIRESEPPKPSSRLLESGESPSVQKMGKATEPAIRARELRGDLDWITMKAMEKEPSRRYASAAALAEDLRRHLDQEPVLARPASRRYRLARLIRRKPMHALLAAVLLVLLPLGGWLTYRNVRQVRQLSEAEVQSLLRQLNRADTDPEKLLGISSRLLALRPESVPGQRARGVAYFNRALHGKPGSSEVLEDQKRSLQIMDDLIGGLPDSAWPVLTKAHFLRYFGKNDEAEALRKQAPTPLHPSSDDDFYTALDLIDNDPGDAERRQALTLLDRVVLKNQRYDAVERRAYLRYELNDYEGAMDDYRFMTKQDPNDYFPHKMVAKTVLRDRKRYQEADQELAKALELAQQYHPEKRWEIHLARASNFYRWAGSINSEKNRDQVLAMARDAEEEARAAVKLEPQEPGPHLNLGSALVLRASLQSAGASDLRREAVKEFEAVLPRVQPEMELDKRKTGDLALTNLCDIYLGDKDLERATPYCRRAAAAETLSRDPVAQYNLAGCLALSGKKEEALAFLEKDLALGDDDYKTLASDPWFETLHKDPRFNDLVMRMKSAYEKKSGS